MADPTDAAPRVNFGQFQGELIVKVLQDGRNMKLLQPYEFVDSDGLRWSVPSGYETDGASIPQFAWTAVGGPFEGLYRNAAVIHDAYCDSREREWRNVHRMFYYAMLANGVPQGKAKAMYAAVYHRGPRWPPPIKCPPGQTCWSSVEYPPFSTLSEDDIKKLMTLIEMQEEGRGIASYQGRPGMTLDQIETFSTQ